MDTNTLNTISKLEVKLDRLQSERILVKEACREAFAAQDVPETTRLREEAQTLAAEISRVEEAMVWARQVADKELLAYV